LNAPEALEKLRQGNARFINNVRGAEPILSQVRRADLVHGQNPFAVILGCSDSRVPAEIIFDQGLGDLFVIRVAGNVVAPSQVGSVEFAVERFDIPLVMVLGHTMCGGVGATLDVLQKRANAGSSGIMSIVDRIRPAIEPLLQTELAGQPDALMRRVHPGQRAGLRQPTPPRLGHHRADGLGARAGRGGRRLPARHRRGGLFRWRAQARGRQPAGRMR
jgi:carbonic anhydrase